MKKYLLFIIMVLSSFYAFTQSITSFRYRVVVKNWSWVQQAAPTTAPVTTTFDASSNVVSKRTTKITQGDITYERVENIPAGTSQNVVTNQTTYTLVAPLWTKGKANIYASKDTLYFNMWRCKLDPTTGEDPLGCIYPEDNLYFTKVPNRIFRSFKYSSFDLGALTIPLKYRFAGKRNDKSYNDDVQADFNLGLYGAYKVGRVRYTYDKYEGMKMYNTWGFSVGPFIGISRAELDTTVTTSADEPLGKDVKRAVAVFSYGVGFMLDVRDFRFGLYIGSDIAAGQAAIKWNYQSRPWLGIGIGYKIPFYTKRE